VDARRDIHGCPPYPNAPGTWDRVAVAQQESIIGRRRESNRRVGAVPDAHANLASAARNDGIKLLRRSYIYHAGIDPNGLMDSGLIFISFQRDPHQFVAIQQRLAQHDPLNPFSQHVAGGVFACPPGYSQGSWLGAELFS
jgi:deferrochelatase/peroxidase EfeB